MVDAKTTITRTFEYKLRTNKKFIAACERELEHSRQIYNAALQERISAYQVAGQSLNFVAQSRSLTEARTLPEVKAHLRTIQSDALERKRIKHFFVVSSAERSQGSRDSRGG